MDSIFGLIFSKWFQLLKNNKFDVSSDKIIMLVGMTINSIKNSIYSRYDNKIIKNNSNNKIEIPPPIFILGHWRSGTTFLHNLISNDNQFNYPRIIQVINPFSFFYIYKKYIRKLEDLENRKRPMDNVKSGPLASGEEEFAIAALLLKSPLVGWVFPKQHNYYENYLDFNSIDENDISEWKETYIYFLKKISINDNRQLILKSPTNTARIKILLEMFPNAKFINIHRNPFKVYNSTVKLHETAIKKSNFQTNFKYDIHHRIINTYKRVYDRYLKEVELIPNGNFVDVSFEDLEKSPVTSIEYIYNELNLSGFDKMKPNLEHYLTTIKNYKKNNHPKMDSNLENQIFNEWEKYFEIWGYDRLYKNAK